MRNIVLKIAYDGTSYLGWQKTSTGKSIEEALEKAISSIVNHSVQLQAASRTDAGVHAAGQIVNFFTAKPISLEKLSLGINARLPNDIRVLESWEGNCSFHPTLDCESKEYIYYLCHALAQSPLERLYSWHYPHALDLDAMDEAAKLLAGSHNFEAFCNMRKNLAYENYEREVSSIQIKRLPQSRLQFTINGKNFLYKMVRNLVGTLVYVGRGKLNLEAIPQLLKSRDRRLIGITAPAHGLCLQRVNYFRA